jgi:hypothetical protein
VAATADLGDVGDYTSSEELAAFTFSEFAKYKNIFNVPYFRGYMLHHVTHAAALLDLYEMGFVEEFQELKDDHRRHAMYLRRLHNASNDDWEKTRITAEDHTSAAFWSREFTDISDFPEDPLNWPVHLVKLHYAFFRLKSVCKDVNALKQAEAQLQFFILATSSADHTLTEQGRKPTPQ